MQEVIKKERLKKLEKKMKKNSMSALPEYKPSHLNKEMTFDQKYRKQKYDAAK